MLLGSIGAMGETVVLGWLTLELTNSPLVVGIAMGMRMAPMFFVGVPAGALADRWPRHRVLMLAGAGQALTTGTLGLLATLGQVTLAHILLLTLAAGTLRALEHAARQSYVHDVVGGAALLPGLAVLGVAMRTGWLVGSLGAGAVIARFGSGAAYLAVAAGFLAGAAALLAASSPTRATLAQPESFWRRVVGFASSMRTDRSLVVLMLLTAGAEMLGFSHQALLPSLARDVLRTGPEGLGTLNAARAVGGILGLTVASMRGPVAGGGALFVTVLLSFGGSLLALGLAPYVVHFAGVVVVLVVVNALGALEESAWPDDAAFIRERLPDVGRQTLDILAAFAAAARAPDDLVELFRALRRLARVQETLYPLAPAFDPVSRWFLDPARRGDDELVARLREATLRDDDNARRVGVLHADNERGSRGGFSLYVPETWDGHASMPLVVALHGGHGHGRDFLWSWLREARARDTLVLAPTSVQRTWSLMGADVDAPRILQMVESVAARYPVDRARVLLTGMSDGGTYAFLCGLRDGAPFTHLAPECGVLHPALLATDALARARDLPIYLVHGELDWMFPVATARMTRHVLTTVGARIVYREIDDLSHTYPRDENPKILAWLAGSRS